MDDRCQCARCNKYSDGSPAEQPRLSHNHSAGSDYCPACTAVAAPAEGPQLLISLFKRGYLVHGYRGKDENGEKFEQFFLTDMNKLDLVDSSILLRWILPEITKEEAKELIKLTAQPSPDAAKVDETKYLKLLQWFKLFYGFFQDDVKGHPSAAASAMSEDSELQEFVKEAQSL